MTCGEVLVAQETVDATGHQRCTIESSSNILFKYDVNGCSSCGITFATITKYIGTDGEVEIPSMLGGYPVAEIGERAFTWNFYATNVVVSDSVTIIKKSAFAYTPRLVSVTVGNSVKHIEEQAFYRCPLLETVVFGDSVETIGKQAFAECKSLKDVEISNNVISIGQEAFYRCSSLNSVIISDSVVNIGNSIFQECVSLVSVTLGDRVESVPYGAFDGCSSLTSVSLSESITSIGKYAFWGCASLKEITIPDSVTFIGMSAFEDCIQLEKCILGDQLDTIDLSAFSNCRALSEIILPQSVKVLGRNAFWGCSSLSAITYRGTINDFYSLKLRTVSGMSFVNIPIQNGEGLAICNIQCADGETKLHCKYTVYKTNENFRYMYSSNGCPCGILEDTEHNEVTIIEYIGSNTEVVIPSYIDGYPVTMVSNAIFRDCDIEVTKVKFPEGITQMFGAPGCSTLTMVEIPASVTIIDSGAFRDCINLTTVVFASNSNLTTISYEAFIGCTSLKNIELPNSVTTIERNAFQDCVALTEFIIPDSVTVIGGHAFLGCTSLSELTISNKIEEIGTGAFEDCSSLYNVTIPDSLKYIFDIFTGCSSLNTVSFGNTVEQVHCNIFDGCTSLSKIIFAGTTEEFELLTITFDYTNSHSLYVHCSDGIIEPDGYFVYSDFICTMPYDQVSIVKYIGNSTEVEIPSEINGYPVGFISNGAFAGDTTVTKITISHEISLDGAFENCTSLKEINFLSAARIGLNAFKNCASLEKVTLGPNSVFYGSDVFVGCSSLREIYYCGSVEQFSSIGWYNNIYYSVLDDNVLGAPLNIHCEDGEIHVHYYDKTSGTVDSVGFTDAIEYEICLCTCGDGYAAIVGRANREAAAIVIPAEIDGYPVTHINDMAFYGLDGINGFVAITELVLPNSIRKIGYGILTSRTVLKRITFMGTIEEFENIEIEESDLGMCPIIECSDGITRAHCNIHGSNRYDFGDYWYNKYGCQYCGEVEGIIISYKGTGSEVVIPSEIDGFKVIAIADNAFSDNSQLTSVTIPDTIISMGIGAFSNCQNLTDVVFEQNSQLSAIGESAFSGCSGLTNIIIPNSVTSIDVYAFNGCSGLTNIIIPNSVTSIGNLAFSNCTGLTSITIPNNVTSVGEYAFLNCTNLKNVSFGNGVTSIVGYTFYGCSSLSSITLSDSITSIGDFAFCKCNSVTTVYYTGTEAEWAKISVGIENSYLTNATIVYNYVPEE